MPRISDIKAQKRRSSRYSVFVDGTYTFSLSELDLVNSGLRIGVQVEAAQIAELQAASQLGKLRDAGYQLLSYRPRSRKELVDHFIRKQWAPEEVALVADELTEQNYLNDERFAQEWVAYRQATSPRSAAILRAELHQKGITSHEIEMALESLDSPTATIQSLIESKRLWQRYGGDKQKLTQYLMRQGFRYSDITSALESDD